MEVLNEKMESILAEIESFSLVLAAHEKNFEAEKT